MSDNFIKSIYVGRHRVDTHPHRFIDINIGTDFKPELISLWNLGLKSLTNIPFHKGYLCILSNQELIFSKDFPSTFELSIV